MNQFLVSTVFVVISIVSVVLMPFVDSEKSGFLMMGSILSLLVGLLPLLYFKYGNKISLSRIGEYVDDYDNIVSDERLWECPPNSFYNVSEKWFNKKLYKLEKTSPSLLRGFWESSDAEASSSPRLFPYIMNIIIVNESPLSRVSVSMDSPLVLTDKQIDSVKEIWFDIIKDFWVFMETYLKNTKWFTEP